MIQTHLYARNAETPVFGSPFVGERPVTLLQQGKWMGVLEDKGDWIHVITIEGEGWVRKELVEVRSPGGLHVVLSGDLRVDYVNSVMGNQKAVVGKR